MEAPISMKKGHYFLEPPMLLHFSVRKLCFWPLIAHFKENRSNHLE